MEQVQRPIDRNFMEIESKLEISILSSLEDSVNLEEEVDERL